MNSALVLKCMKELNISYEEESNTSLGLVFSMMIEKANDKEEYPYKATQEDIDSFFPG